MSDLTPALALPIAALDDPLMRELIGILRQPAYHATVNALPGCSADDTGRIFRLDKEVGWA